MLLYVQLDFKWLKLLATLSLSPGNMCLCVMIPRLRMLNRRGSRRASTSRETGHLEERASSQPGEDFAFAARAFDWGAFYCAEIPAHIEADIVTHEEALLKEIEFREGL